ncbi:hypothetical protein M045_gp36 [Mycobacterium phage HINdeR]|uniref:Uncharacterized protein n=1 Tax=Mycobacterium phage HINdeR TaxID=1327770 RepID=R4JLH3_9CAUD|nr:hypothetical protein M045_gp36 [Mycobacterium phage HINdeR]AGK87515.1 hypothetical protein PBI_HINDER_36 [Mycobacterium phage HINdeR]
MILWCRTCHRPVQYSHSGAFRYEFFRSDRDSINCIDCAVARLDAK